MSCYFFFFVFFVFFFFFSFFFYQRFYAFMTLLLACARVCRPLTYAASYLHRVWRFSEAKGASVVLCGDFNFSPEATTLTCPSLRCINPRVRASHATGIQPRPQMKAEKRLKQSPFTDVWSVRGCAPHATLNARPPIYSYRSGRRDKPHHPACSVSTRTHAHIHVRSRFPPWNRRPQLHGDDPGYTEDTDVK